MTTTIDGYTPAQIRHAYGFDEISIENGAVNADGSGQTIAIVDAFNDPNVAADLNTFDAQFGLPSADLSVVNQTGGRSLPTTDAGWAGEIALDVEWAHAIAPGAKILLVEASSDTIDDLTTAVDYARHVAGVSTVSMSWGGSEFFSWSGGESQRQTSYDPIFTTPAGHQGVTFLSAAGDTGSVSGVQWPSSSPNVISVGGTSLFTSDSNGTYAGERGWGGTNGGFSQVENEPSFQQSAQTSSARTVADVAYDADPNTGFAVYDSLPFQGTSGWEQVGGTSAGAPQWAALIAIADQARAAAGLGSLDGATQTLPALYSAYAAANATTVSPQYATTFNDVLTGGSSGFRWRWGGFGSSGYSAMPGYDLITGLGSPQAGGVVAALLGSSSGSTGGSSGATPTSTPSNLPPSPIQVTSVSSPPANVIDGQRGAARITLTNTGSETFNGPVTVTLYASTDGTVSSDDATLTTLSINQLKLKAGKSKTLKLSFDYPSSMPGGTYEFVASADATGTNTAPAAAPSPSAVVVAAATVDLSAAFNDTNPITITPGRHGIAIVTVTNLGNVTATGTLGVNLFAGQSATLNSSDPMLASMPERKISLKPGKKLMLKVRFLAPTDTAAGTYGLLASITSSTTPADSNADNDVASIPTA